MRTGEASERARAGCVGPLGGGARMRTGAHLGARRERGVARRRRAPWTCSVVRRRRGSAKGRSAGVGAEAGAEPGSG
jgi:hypothetical protein